MSSSARKVIALNCTRYTICFDCSPAGGSNGTVGVRFIAFEEAIIFPRSKDFLPADQMSTDEKESC